MVSEGLWVGADLQMQGHRPPGARVGKGFLRRRPRGEGGGDERPPCWSFKAGQPHNLQKRKPCSLRSINRPQIESGPFIFQILCEKRKTKIL